MHGDLPPVKPLIDIPRMAELSRSMLRRSLDAFIRRTSADELMVTTMVYGVEERRRSYELLSAAWQDS